MGLDGRGDWSRSENGRLGREANYDGVDYEEEIGPSSYLRLPTLEETERITSLEPRRSRPVVRGDLDEDQLVRLNQTLSQLPEPLAASIEEIHVYQDTGFVSDLVGSNQRSNDRGYYGDNQAPVELSAWRLDSSGPEGEWTTTDQRGLLRTLVPGSEHWPADREVDGVAASEGPGDTHWQVVGQEGEPPLEIPKVGRFINSETDYGGQPRHFYEGVDGWGDWTREGDSQVFSRSRDIGDARYHESWDGDVYKMVRADILAELSETGNVIRGEGTEEDVSTSSPTSAMVPSSTGQPVTSLFNESVGATKTRWKRRGCLNGL